jgi:uncharacterized protein (DUF924 family)
MVCRAKECFNGAMKALLDYWFGDLDHTPEYFQNRNKLWFMGGPKVDSEIKNLFAVHLERAGHGELDTWADAPKGAVALIVLLDQISLGVHRNEAEGFRLSEAALPFARRMIDRSWHETLSPAEKIFIYLALEHSERMNDQERCVGLFTTLALSVPEELRKTFEGYLEYALRHRKVVQRFGRFPHRNAALGRESTREEQLFLASPEAPF